MTAQGHGVRSWLARHDPGYIGLRRGIRAAIALPVALFITLTILGDTSGSSFAGFGAVGLLMTADYAGSARQRTLDYLGTGVVVTGLIMIGLAVSDSPVTAAIGTFVVALLVNLASMLRGNIAVGAPAALLMFIVAVCIGHKGTTTEDALAAWWVAVIVCTLVALVILPRQRQDIARHLLAEVVERSADMAHATWLEPLDPAKVRSLADSLDGALEELRGVHAGKPFRTSGVTRQERSLSLLIDHTWGMRQVVRDPTFQERPTAGTGATVEAARVLAQAIVDAQRASAAALRDPTNVPTIDALVAARDAYREALVTDVLARSDAGTPPSEVAANIAGTHLISMASVIAEQTMQLVREANGRSIQQTSGALPIPQRSITTFLRSQLTLDSGWLRNALRSAVGLGIAMVIVTLTNIEDGFWVLLGVIAVLRFDSFTTRRNAWQALLGTVLGVVGASLVIYAVGGNLAVMWVLLPIAVFLAGWSAVAVNYPIAQASFTGFVLIMVAITKWPPNLLTGDFRIIDIALGAFIALVVALVLWPQGALGALHNAMSRSIRDAWAYAATVARAFASPSDSHQVRDTLGEARRSILVGAEAYDVALMQRGPGMPRFAGWLALTGDAYLLVNLGRTMEPFSADARPARWSPSLSALVDQRTSAGDDYWESLATRIAGGDVFTWGSPPPAGEWSTLAEAPTTHDEALGFVVTVWFLDWFDRIDRIRAAAHHPDAVATTSS